MELQNGYDVKCIVETPEHIAEFMTNELAIDYNSDFFVLEPAVGRGNIFVKIVESYLKFAHYNRFSESQILHDLNQRFFAFDVDKASIVELTDRLNSLLNTINIDGKKVVWNFFVFDLLTTHHHEMYNKITHCICNPPYIAYRNLSEINREQLKQFESCKQGLPNLFYAFIEFAVIKLPNIKKSVYINPSSYLIGKSAIRLRELIVENQYVECITEFRDDVFNNAQVKVCISTYSRNSKSYKHQLLNNELKVLENYFSNNQPSSNGFYASKENNNIKTDYTIGDLFHVYGSIATLDDYFYMIKEDEIIHQNNNIITISKKIDDDQFKEFYVEKDILKQLHVSSKRKSKKKRLIIYPYDKQGVYFGDEVVREKFPYLWDYFQNSNKKDSTTLEFGRSQNLSKWSNTRYVIPKSISSFFFDEIKGKVVNSGLCLEIKEEYKQDEKEIINCFRANSIDFYDYIRKHSIKNDENYVALTTEVIKKTPVWCFTRKKVIDIGAR